MSDKSNLDAIPVGFELLADNIQAAKLVARWYYDQWLSKQPNVRLENVEKKLAGAINREKAPLIVLASQSGDYVGAAEFKLHEMNIFPQYEHWLGGVYVVPSARGAGIATALTKKVLSYAKRAGVKKLYLQTEALDGGLYRACGFVPLEHVRYNGRDVLVMVAEP